MYIKIHTVKETYENFIYYYTNISTKMLLNQTSQIKHQVLITFLTINIFKNQKQKARVTLLLETVGGTYRFLLVSLDLQ